MGGAKKKIGNFDLEKENLKGNTVCLSSEKLFNPPVFVENLVWILSLGMASQENHWRDQKMDMKSKFYSSKFFWIELILKGSRQHNNEHQQMTQGRLHIDRSFDSRDLFFSFFFFLFSFFFSSSFSELWRQKFFRFGENKTKQNKQNRTKQITNSRG